MPSEIPSDLISSIRDGRTVLLLGAGASRGSTNSAGQKIPMATELAAELAAEFLGPEYAELSFREVYDLSCNQRDVRSVQKFVHDKLIDYYPADFHGLIPTFGWAGILTTNYDLIIERAYETAGKTAVQRLIPHVKDKDGATSDLDQRSILYVKLHGCVTRFNETDPPMIASTEQLISFGDGRKGQFDVFLELSRTKNIVFVGYSFGDSNLRQLIDIIIKEGDKRPRHFIVDPGMLPAYSEYWRDRRFITIKLGFADFLQSIDSLISQGARNLSSLSAAFSTDSTFTKFITTSGQTESNELKQYLKYNIEHITENFEPKREDTKKFYKGFNICWQPYAEDLDIHRKISDDILSDHVISNIGSNTQQLIILKGHAGSGKTVTIRRICWDAAHSYGKICFFISRSSTIKSELFEEIFSLTNLTVFIFIDGVGVHKNKILELLAVAKSSRSNLIIIGTESFNTWNTSCEELERQVFAEHEMRLLSDKEAEDLLSKLEQHNSLGNLSKIPRGKRTAEFMTAFGRQILVALLEATHGVPLVEIISNEYKSIVQPEARLLYLDICSLHRFGPPVRAGLISRIHGIDFEDFERRLFRPLEQIVQLREDRAGDYIYEARHPQIASALYDAVLTSQEERFDNLVRLITKLNPSYSYDMEALSKIIRAENISNTISDDEKGRQIYELAFEHIGRLPMLIHQRGIYELRISKSIDDLKVAGDYLEDASKKEPWNRSIKHSLAELDLRRSRVSRDDLERSIWRRSAISRASDLTLGDSSPYPYHTILKALTDEVTDAIKRVDSSETEANVQHLGDSIANAEETLKRGLANFPSDQTLLGSEGELARVLSNSIRAEAAFRKAFTANPRSTLVAKRLVRILRSKDDFDGCIAIVQKALENNQGNAELHFELAKLYMDRSYNGDAVNADEVLFHLRRSFVSGDKNYNAQFWYGRQLCISDNYADAKQIFTRIEGADVSHTIKNKIGGIIKSEDGTSKRFNGVMTRFRSSFGFARCDSPQLDLFVPVREMDEAAGRSFIEGSAISFEIGFNYKGPIALRLKHSTSR